LEVRPSRAARFAYHQPLGLKEILFAIANIKYLLSEIDERIFVRGNFTPKSLFISFVRKPFAIKASRK
jgi:hypothetical protein